MQHNNYFLVLAVIMLTMLLFSCAENQQNSGECINFSSDNFVKVDIDLNSEYYDSVFNLISRPKIIPLKENDETMFADLNKLIVRDGKYYVLDTNGSRTAVSFNADGSPFAKYGKVGQGPGEYFRPADMDVYDGIVYILDLNLQKLIRYKDSGEFMDEVSTPFRAEAIHVDENTYLFCPYLHEEYAGKINQICVTDSNLHVRTMGLPISDGYVNGLINHNYLRSGFNSTAYYKTPCDTMFMFDEDANPYGGIIFNFGSFSVPELAHVDLIKAMENHQLEGTRMLTNTPISLAGGYMAATVSEDSKTKYIVIFNPTSNRCGGKKYKDMDSVFDILSPLAADEEGNLISYASLEDLQGKKGYDQLPDSIKTQLEDNNRILLIYPFSKLAGK